MKIIRVCTGILFTTIFYLLLAFEFANGQATTASPTNTPGATTDYLGWSTTDDLDFKTSGLQRMRLIGTGGANDGFLGIGLIVLNFRLDVQDDINLEPGLFPNTGYRWDSEVILKTNSTTENIFLGFSSGDFAGGTANTFLGAYSGMMKTNNGGGNTFVGWNAGSSGADVAESVFIGSRAGEFNNGTTNCFVGVLTGNGGSINISSGNAFFGNSAGRINSGDHNTFIGNASGVNNTSDLNTFVGYSSGNANTTGRNNAFLGGNSGSLNNTGSNLTFLGFESGLNNINGANNTFGGSMSGRANTTGNDLTFFGFESGVANTGGIKNTFGGSASGRTNTTGNDNSFYGFQTGYTNNKGNENVFCGASAGYLNRDGSHNTFTGFEAGYSNSMDIENTYYGNISGRSLSSGTMNTFVGSQSGTAVNTASTTTLIGAGTSAANSLTNATALGFNASVMQKDNMILGNNQIRVGIGLSGNAVGPQTVLEINTSTPVTTGNSGLRFRTLTSSSPSNVTGVTKVLTVNGSGDVILGDIPGSGGSVLACPSGLLNTNYITKISATNEICKTEGIYEMPSTPYTVGIGVGTSPNPWAFNNFKLDMKGDLVLRHDFNNQVGGDIWMTDHTGNPPRRVLTMYGLGGFGTLALGPDAGSNSQFTSGSASGCIYIGRNVGTLTANSLNNTFVGFGCGNIYNDVSGKNTIVGAGTAGNLTTGSRNTFIGESSGNSLQSGEFNTYVGQEAGHGGILSGNQNVLIGQNTYINANSGDMNICIGSGAHSLNWLGTISNSISLGAGCRVSASNFITMGFQVPVSIPEQQIGLGYQAPPAPGIMSGNLAKLYVQNYAGGTASAFFNGDIYTSTVLYPSDSMLKDNITPFTDASAFLNQLESKSYVFKQNAFPGLNLPSGNQIGLLAEDIEMVAPQLVSTASSPALYDSIGNVVYPQVDFKAVNYTGLIPVLLTAIKQQKQYIDSLAIIVSQCCSSPIISNPGSENRSSIQLSNQDMVILNQNAPNPFRDKTEITYSIPETIENAVILFYDQNGRVINSFKIAHRGQGTLTVYGDDLTGGIYTYTLMVDDKPIQSKRMVKE